MKPLSIEQIAHATGGRLSGDPSLSVSSVVIDSQQAGPASLFVPQIGQRVDAHNYIASAVEHGAVAAVVSRPPTPLTQLTTWVEVPDTRRALQDIARYHRQRFSFPLITVTGSVGKTSTKDMIAAALASRWQVAKTAGNMNSQVGLPLSLLTLDDGDQAGVFELGMSEFGEITELSLISCPDIAVITNIGISHIEQLGSQENILREKLSVGAGMSADGIMVLKGDDPFLARQRDQLPQKTVFYGMADWCDYRAEEIISDLSGVSFVLVCDNRRQPVHLPVPGRHNIYNALAALTVADLCGIELDAAAGALANFHGEKMRLQIIDCGGIHIIDDTYNASPDSMRAALAVLADLKPTGRRIAVLADMFELGALSEQSHYNLGKTVAELGIDVLLTVGERAAGIADGAMATGGSTLVERFPNNNEANARLQQLLTPGDAVLVKGSRGMHTEEIVEGIMAGQGGRGND